MNFKLPIANYQLPTGFTLVEALVAVTILTLAVVGPMFTANRAIVAAQISRDQLTASYLAQEGIEFIRAVRDDAYLNLYPGDTSSAWSDFLTSIVNCGTSIIGTAPFCTLDPVGNAPLQVCPSGICAPLWLSSTNVFTQQQISGIKTIYTRTIQTVQKSATDEQVVSKVTWNFHGITHNITIYGHLTPWQ
jgi:Tfp pilus assembly protein PilV